MVRQPYDSGNESDAYNGDLHTTQVLTTSTSSHQGTMDLHNDPLDGFEGLTVPDALRSSTTSKKSRTPRSTANAKVGQSKISNMDQEDSDSDGSVDPNSAESKLYSKQIQAVNRKKNKSGGFQSMGLMANVLRAVLNKGYKVPTPIQRKCIPLVLEGKDVVGMARTGSGKTAAFTIPLVNRLRNHSAKVGVRGLILSPSRELALQTLKFAKELSKYTDLRHCALVGGDRLEEQYEMMAANPDILVATPGRCLHLIVEMNLDLSSVEYVVFDEADRLFEMGFSVQLHEILHRLPPSRQTLLFSATLPNNLVDFAKAGLHEPELVRLDVDTKI
ncbi:ATP-dependent RNA helicase dbp10, partial [Dispira parvispora]